MVNPDKIKKKLPGLLINDATGGFDTDYQHKRNKLAELQRKKPLIYNGFLNSFTRMLDELDREAEQAGFLHVDFDRQGNLVRKTKQR
jgi:hypothetical protein